MTSTLSIPRTRSDAAAPALDFEALYRSSRDDVYAYVATIVRDRSAAEDVTAAAFEKAYRKQRAFDGRRGSARQWLFGIARHVALDELRRRKRQATLTHDPPDTAGGGDFAAAAIDKAVVRAALGRLQVKDREIIALRFHAGLDTAEVAGVLGVTPNHAGTLLHRAMTNLREAINASNSTTSSPCCEEDRPAIDPGLRPRPRPARRRRLPRRRRFTLPRIAWLGVPAAAVAVAGGRGRGARGRERDAVRRRRRRRRRTPRERPGSAGAARRATPSPWRPKRRRRCAAACRSRPPG